MKELMKRELEERIHKVEMESEAKWITDSYRTKLKNMLEYLEKLYEALYSQI